MLYHHIGLKGVRVVIVEPGAFLIVEFVVGLIIAVMA